MFQNLVRRKTDFVFVQPGAKLNSVYYCENLLEQGLHTVTVNSIVLRSPGILS